MRLLMRRLVVTSVLIQLILNACVGRHNNETKEPIGTAPAVPTAKDRNRLRDDTQAIGPSSTLDVSKNNFSHPWNNTEFVILTTLATPYCTNLPYSPFCDAFIRNKSHSDKNDGDKVISHSHREPRPPSPPITPRPPSPPMGGRDENLSDLRNKKSHSTSKPWTPPTLPSVTTKPTPIIRGRPTKLETKERHLNENPVEIRTLPPSTTPDPYELGSNRISLSYRDPRPTLSTTPQPRLPKKRGSNRISHSYRDPRPTLSTTPQPRLPKKRGANRISHSHRYPRTRPTLGTSPQYPLFKNLGDKQSDHTDSKSNLEGNYREPVTSPPLGTPPPLGDKQSDHTDSKSNLEGNYRESVTSPPLGTSPPLDIWNAIGVFLVGYERDHKERRIMPTGEQQENENESDNVIRNKTYGPMDFITVVLKILFPISVSSLFLFSIILGFCALQTSRAIRDVKNAKFD